MITAKELARAIAKCGIPSDWPDSEPVVHTSLGLDDVLIEGSHNLERTANLLNRLEWMRANAYLRKYAAERYGSFDEACAAAKPDHP